MARRRLTMIQQLARRAEPATQVLAYRAFVVAPPSARRELYAAFEELAAAFQARAAAAGARVYEADAYVRDLTLGESVGKPRKVHLRAPCGSMQLDTGKPRIWICATPHVSERNVTDVPSEVTCKLCIEVMMEENDAAAEAEESEGRS